MARKFRLWEFHLCCVLNFTLCWWHEIFNSLCYVSKIKSLISKWTVTYKKLHFCEELIVVYFPILWLSTFYSFNFLMQLSSEILWFARCSMNIIEIVNKYFDLPFSWGIFLIISSCPSVLMFEPIKNKTIDITSS